MREENGSSKTRDPHALLLDLLSLLATKESAKVSRRTGAGPARPAPKHRHHRRVQVGLFTNILMSHCLLFPFSAFVGRGGR